MQNPKRPYYALLGLTFIAGVGAVYGSVHPLVADLLSREWASTKGSVTRAEAIRTQRHGSHDTTVDVEYRYDVGGTTYTGTRVALWRFQKAAGDDVQGFIRSHPVGSEIEVFYQREQPGTAVLIRKREEPLWQLLFFGLAFMVAGALFSIGVSRTPDEVFAAATRR